MLLALRRTTTLDLGTTGFCFMAKREAATPVAT
jgi:hypothetical protein